MMWKIVISAFVIASVLPALAQNESITWSILASGRAVAASQGDVIDGVVGQVMTGISLDGASSLIVGFYSNPSAQSTIITAVEDYAEDLPNDYRLFQNYPNPFNPTTEIRIQVSVFSHVMLKIYDVLGREIATLIDENKQQGSYSVPWDASGAASGVSARGGYASGVYFCRLSARPIEGGHASTFTDVKKMVVLR